MKLLLLIILLVVASLHSATVPPPLVSSKKAVAGEWNPPSGMVYWFAARKLVGTNDNDRLGTIEDFSGNNYHGWAHSDPQRPYYIANAVNSKPAFRFFDGTNSFNLSNVVSGLTSGEVYVVMKVEADPAAGDATSGFWELGTSLSSAHVPYSDGNIYDGFGSTVRKATGDPVASMAAWRLYNVVSADSAWTNLIDTAVHYGTGANTVGFSPTPKLGSSYNFGTYQLNGYVAELLLFDHVLSQSDRSSVETELDNLYNLSY